MTSKLGPLALVLLMLKARMPAVSAGSPLPTSAPSDNESPLPPLDSVPPPQSVVSSCLLPEPARVQCVDYSHVEQLDTVTKPGHSLPATDQLLCYGVLTGAAGILRAQVL